jgi:hypothetical protein
MARRGFAVSVRTAAILALLVVAAWVGTTGATSVVDPQVEAVRGLVGRLLGAQHVDSFDFGLVPPQPHSGNDLFQLLPTHTVNGYPPNLQKYFKI